MTVSQLLMTVYACPKTGRLTGQVTGLKPLYLEDVCGIPVKLGGFKAIVADWNRLDDNDLVDAISDAFRRRGGAFRRRLQEMLAVNLTAANRESYREVVLAAADAELGALLAEMETEAKRIEEAAKAVSEVPVAAAASSEATAPEMATEANGLEEAATAASEVPVVGAASTEIAGSQSAPTEPAKAPEKPKDRATDLRKWAGEFKEAVERACQRRPRGRDIRRRGWIGGYAIAMEMYRLPSGNIGGHLVGTNGPLASSAHKDVKGSSWYGVSFEVDSESGRVLKLEQRSHEWFAAMVPDRRNRGKTQMRKPFLVVVPKAIKPRMVVPHTEPRGSETSVRFLWTGPKGAKVGDNDYPIYSANVPDLGSLFADSSPLPKGDETDRREVRLCGKGADGVVLGVVRRKATEAEVKRGRHFFVEVSGEMHRSMDGTGAFNELVCFARDPEGKHWDIQMFRKGTLGQASVLEEDEEADTAQDGDATAPAK